MRDLLAAFTFLIFAALAAGCTQPGSDVAAIEAIDNAVAELDEAFESQDAAAAKALMTEDHVSVTPYYGAPLSVAEVIASLPDLKIKQTNLTEPTVAMLAPDVAMRTLTAKLNGRFKGETFDERVFIISIMVEDNGKWLERFYEVTRLAP